MLRCTWAQVVGPPSQTFENLCFWQKYSFSTFLANPPRQFCYTFLLVVENVRWWLGWTVTTNPTGQTLRNWQITVFLGKTKGLEDFARKGHISWSLATGREDQVRHTEFFSKGFRVFSKKIHFKLSHRIFVIFWRHLVRLKAAVVLFPTRLSRNIHLKNSLRTNWMKIPPQKIRLQILA